MWGVWKRLEYGYIGEYGDIWSIKTFGSTRTFGVRGHWRVWEYGYKGEYGNIGSEEI